MRLKPIFVARSSSDIWWEQLRQLRNACAGGFTHARAEITVEQQRGYRETYRENVRHYLYLTPDGEVAAFSRLEWKEDGYVYPTYGVAPYARGKGYVWEVVKHAMLAAGGPLRGDLLFSNEAIKKVDFALGWRSVGPLPDEGGVLAVEADWPPAFLGDLL